MKVTVHALADAGMSVAVVDFNGDDAQRVAGSLRDRGVHAIALQCDVADRMAVDAMADAAYSEFGAVHVLHNNAGIYFPGLLENTTHEQWRLTLEVNLIGVINGVQTFLPRILGQGGEAHIVNTASMAGICAGQYLGSYTATKYAVVGLSETMRNELEARGIGVSVVCPASVATNIFNNSLALAGITPAADLVEQRPEDAPPAMDPMEAGRIIRAGIESNEMYILTHPELKFAVQARADRLLAAFDRAAALRAAMAQSRER